MIKTDKDILLRLRRLSLFLLTLFLIWIVYILLNKAFGFGIPCIVHKLTGVYCPGCGISRMFISLSSLDFKAAAGYNLLALVSLPFFLVFAIEKSVKYVKRGSLELDLGESVFLFIIFIAAIIFGILRNIEYFSFLAP